MILLDTNVLIYGFDPRAPLHSWAAGIIRSAILGEGAAINPVILTEYLVGEQTPETAIARFDALGFSILDLPAAASLRCAHAYAAYLENRRQQSAATNLKLPLPDFFIGAHASILNLSLATADVSRYQRYFPEVRLLTPHND